MQKTSLKNRIFIVLSVLLAAILLTSCGSPQSTTIVIGTKGFAEQFILGEMYALLLEDAGFTVERKGALGGTPVLHEAITNEALDLYPEYTGTGLLTVLQMEVMSDPSAVFDTVSAAYLEQFELVWLDPAPMNNTQALAMQAARAQELGIVTFSDLSVQAPNLVLAGPVQFPEREDGLPGLQALYGGFEFSNYLAVDYGLRYPTLLSGDADVVVAFGTDGEIFANGLRVLVDDKGLYPPYQVAPLIRKAVLDANPEIAEILNTVAPLLDDTTMQELNYLVTGEGREPQDVARDFLLENGLISE
ncbi:MAG: hypothetical protein JW862_06340 [Anaerolineales bacterium]|nr:hypothetical protein [Anaerolineales bacterium]